MGGLGALDPTANAAARTRHIVKTFFLMASLSVMLLSACGPAVRTFEQTPSYAPDQPTRTQLARAVSQLGDPRDGRSGVRLIGNGEEAIAARLALAAAAEQTIDAQYYLLHDDLTGHVFAWSLLQAADRGVRVRLLLDDMDTGGYDAATAALDAHENVEIRLFNPFWRDQNLLAAGLTDFKRINRRMHNKSMTADNAMSIVGGRNIGDEYFLAKRDMNYSDIDVLVAGPVVDAVSTNFDAYWNSRFAVPARAVIGAPKDMSLDAARDRLDALIGDARELEYASVIRRARAQNFTASTLALEWVPARMYSDPPSKAAGANDDGEILASQLAKYFAAAKSDVQIISAYFVPRDRGSAWLAELEDKGVEVSVVTNSLASNDVKPVYAHYAKDRRRLLESGVSLYELRPDADRAQRRGVNWGQSQSGLHAKAFTIDDRYLFVGSFNWDPRSVNINTEMGILIDSPTFTANASEALSEALEAEAFAVRLEEDNRISWTETDPDGTQRIYYHEPTGSPWDHFVAGLYALLPIGSQL
ncbi:putative phospholipase D protein [Dinoroseobacter shibae DFL 12 = DSM 16493]|jgi:putative cardiolipin synthase|uniref:Phospholipase D n=1 Tax=Dinoroseobacter shibae (strain DSM 16493 / NCIMB 14021 / DFL 12) TaxID=398580 RepID=A8LM34_DINSH|nr:putative phospholipase D protein [Dinoroseobacter shibae DFL 12 = DSM 16493]